MTKIETAAARASVPLLSDWAVNRGDVRVQIALYLFRLAGRLRTAPRQVARVLGRAVSVAYVVVVEWTWGIELPWSTTVGERLRIFHGTGLVVNGAAILGNDVILRQGACIGSKGEDHASRFIGDGVEVGANSIALGANSRRARSEDRCVSDRDDGFSCRGHHSWNSWQASVAQTATARPARSSAYKAINHEIWNT